MITLLTDYRCYCGSGGCCCWQANQVVLVIHFTNSSLKHALTSLLRQRVGEKKEGKAYLEVPTVVCVETFEFTHSLGHEILHKFLLLG